MAQGWKPGTTRLPRASPCYPCPGLGSVLTLRTGQVEKKHEGNYPGIVLNGATLPCPGRFSCVKAQCSARAWQWIPWKKGLRRDNALRSKSRQGKSGDLLEIMFQAAGLGQDEWDLEWWKAPLKVTSFLRVRAHPYCTCVAGRLSSRLQCV